MCFNINFTLSDFKNNREIFQNIFGKIAINLYLNIILDMCPTSEDSKIELDVSMWPANNKMMLM